jgi:hypothetical protein
MDTNETITAVIPEEPGGIPPISETSTAPSEPPHKEPFYRMTWFVIVLAIFIPPVGILLAWLFKKPVHRCARIILTAVAALLLATYIIVPIASLTSHKETASSTTTGTTQTSSSQKETVAPTLVSISATYSGKTTAGISITSSNSDIKVTATYSDGSSKSVTGWTIGNPTSLVAEQTYDFSITYQDKTCHLNITCTTPTESTYKSKCESVDYDSIARNPDTYKGKYVEVRGEVVQVQEGSSGSGNTYRVDITKGKYDIWSDTIMVTFTPSSTSSRILEDDIVTIYGVSGGLYTYTSVMGASITVPLIYAAYIDVE